jgi:hypothetical protein
MQARELFSVLLKVLGVADFVAGVQLTPTLVGQYWHWENEAGFLALLIATALGASGIRLITGCVLFFGADWFTRKAYPEQVAPASQ